MSDMLISRGIKDVDEEPMITGFYNLKYNLNKLDIFIEKDRAMEEFSEQEAEYYNKCIEKLENEDYSETYSIKLKD